MSNKKSSFRRKQRIETITIPVDPNDFRAFATEQTRLREAFQALEAAQAAHGDVDALQAELTAAQAAHDGALVGVPTMTFTFQAMSPAALQGLQADHPPKAREVEAAKKLDVDPPDFDGETYPAALIAASCVKVAWSEGDSQDGISEDEATELVESSSTGDVALLMAIIGGVNNTPSLVSDLGKDSAATRHSGLSPTTAAPEASPPSSS